MIGELDNALAVYLNSSDKEVCNKFKLWAFGEYYHESLTPMFHLELWNIRHKEEYELTPDGFIYEDLKKMVKLYKERQ